METKTRLTTADQGTEIPIHRAFAPLSRWLLYFSEWTGTVIKKERKKDKMSEGRAWYRRFLLTYGIKIG